MSTDVALLSKKFFTSFGLEKEEITAKDVIGIYDRIKEENKVLEKK